MYLRKTIVLVALAALAAAPSGLAYWAPEEPDSASTIVQHQPAAYPAKPTKPAKPKAKKVTRPAYCTPLGPVLLREVAPGGSLGASGSPDSGEPDAVRSR